VRDVDDAARAVHQHQTDREEGVDRARTETQEQEGDVVADVVLPASSDPPNGSVRTVPRPRVRAAVLAGLLALTACSSGGSDDPGGGPDAEPTEGLSGDPVVVGFVNMEGSPAGSFPEATAGAEAAVAHVNDELGGIDGRPLRLETCTTDGTQESSQACARRLVAARPAAVVGGVDLRAEASVPGITG
jgi:hypothetical protein